MLLVAGGLPLALAPEVDEGLQQGGGAPMAGSYLKTFPRPLLDSLSNNLTRWH
jgi:hypothetical protein